MQDQNQQLSNYIYQELQRGNTPDTISAQLQQAGWSQDLITAAFQQVQSFVVPQQPLQPVAATTGSTVSTETGPPPEASGKRRGKIKTGWQLFVASMHLLNGNRYLFRYLLMTWIVIIAIEAAIFATVWFGYNLFINHDGSDNGLWYIFVAFSYVLIYFVINLYAAALSANILDIYKGKREPYSNYMQRARSKAGPILLFSIFQAIVGLILEYIIDRIRFVGWIISWLLGTLWSLATMFVLPIIVDGDKGAVQAVKESVGLFKKTWGENVTAKATVNTPLALIQIALASVFWFLALPTLSGGIGLFIFVIIVYLFFAISVAILGSFANSIVNMALYYYALHRQVPPGFTADMLNHVFIERKFARKKPQN